MVPLLYHKRRRPNMERFKKVEMVKCVPKNKAEMCSVVEGREPVPIEELLSYLKNFTTDAEGETIKKSYSRENSNTELPPKTDASPSLAKAPAPNNYMPITNTIRINPMNSSYNMALDSLFSKPMSQPMFAGLKLEKQLDFCECLISVLPIKSRDEKLYVYNGRFYELASENMVRKAIVYFFREQLRKKDANFLDGIIRYLKSEPIISFDEKSICRHLISFENVVLDINTGITYPHNKDFMTTYAINAKFLGQNIPPTPVFDAFLHQISGGDNLIASRVVELLGYVLSCDVGAKCLVIFQGKSNSGKTVLCKLIQSLFSINAYMPIHADKLNGRFALSEIYGKSLLICSDFTAAPINEDCTAILKQISGADTLISDQKYKGSIRFDFYGKIIICSNHPILTKVNDDAFRNRLVTVPFKYAVTKENQNPSLVEDMLNERDGIVTKAIFAYWRLRNNKYVFSGDFEPNLVVENNKQNSVEIDIYNFVNDNFEPAPNSIVFTSDAYYLFVDGNGEIPQNQFSQYFKKFAQLLFNARAARKRKDGADNASHCVIGMKLKC